jgi:hypothetical protein
MFSLRCDHYFKAQKLYEEAIAKSLDFYVNEPSLSLPDELLEFNLWEEKWIKCCRELNQWNELCEYSTTKDNDLNLNLECAWKQPNMTDWQSMKSILLAQKDTSLPKDQSWRWSLYQVTLNRKCRKKKRKKNFKRFL